MLKGNDMVMRTLINDDFTAATVLVRMKNNGKGLEITKNIREAVAKVEGPGKVTLGGLPVIKEPIS